MARVSPGVTAILSIAAIMYSFMNDFNKYLLGGALIVLIVSILMMVQD